MTPLRYLSLFSGIGGFDLGFDRAGMVCVGQVEFDKRARSVLARHWPDVPRMNDVREVQGHEFGTVDLICGGFPCQPHSVAGKRKASADERDMWPEFARIIRAVRPRWVVAENVPGILSSESGRYFGGVLRDLADCGYDVAWRVLDAQYFGVAQRRRRVFIVGYSGNSGRAAEVLFEREGGGGDFAPGRGSREVSATVTSKWSKGTGGRSGNECQNLISHTLTGSAARGATEDGCGRGVPLVASTFNAYTGGADDNDAQGGHLVFDWQSGGDVRHSVSDRHTSALQASQTPAAAFIERTRPGGVSLEMQEELAYALTNPGAGSRTTSRNIAGAFGVRRLTPTECERLQGFPDNWTAYGADGPQSDSARYRQLGNAVAVPVAEWLGRCIAESESCLST